MTEIHGIEQVTVTRVGTGRMMRDRKLNRLKDYDYAKEGYYFVTVCTQGRKEWFGGIKDGAMVLNGYGSVVNQQWVWLREQYGYVELDEFIVMPNHFHGILLIVVGNGRDRSLRKIKSLSELMGAFKTTSSKLIRRAGLSEFQWQKSFYDHIIRNDADLARVREYIHNNPLKWGEDEENVNAPGLPPGPFGHPLTNVRGAPALCPDTLSVEELAVGRSRIVRRIKRK